MPISYQQLVDNAIDMAAHGQPDSVLQNLEAVAESNISQIFQSVGEAAANNENKRSLLRRVKTVTLVAGEDTLTDDVLTAYFSDATLVHNADLSKKYAYRDYQYFISAPKSQIGLFTRNGTTLMVREPNQAYVVPLTATGARSLAVECIPVRPTLATDIVDVPDEIGSDLVEALAQVLKGALPKIAGINT